MMTDVVYALGTGSRWHNNEIRFSLRSIEKHLKNYRRVWIVGAKPPSVIQNVHHIPFPDKTPVPDTNIMYKITEACKHPEVSDDFLFFNDDHYLLQDFEAQNFPYFYHGTIDQYLTRRSMDGYTARVKNTGEYLRSKGLPTKFFDVHTPIIFNKLKFLELVTNGPDWTMPKMYVMKSIYANSIEIEGIEQTDNKTEKPPVDSKIFSTGPRVTALVQRFLLEQFPRKSKFESHDFSEVRIIKR